VQPFLALILFFAWFFSGALTSQRRLYTFFLAGLQVEGVSLDLLDNVILLHLAFEAAQNILEGFALLKSDFCQIYTPPDSSRWTEYLLQGFDCKSSRTDEFLYTFQPFFREFPAHFEMVPDFDGRQTGRTGIG